MKYIIGLMAMLLPILTGAQLPPIKALGIGDTVPDIVFNHAINYKTSTAKLSDFKGKLVILDFWATSCMTCVYSLPAIDSLQNQFKDEVQFLLVNPKISRDDTARINKFLGILKKNKGFDVRLPMMLFDETASALFPFRFLPHYVWIGSDGIVKAITAKKEITVHNIHSVLTGKNIQMPIKNDWQEIINSN